MDAELSRIAAEVLRPGEQLLWAGKPLDRGPMQLPPFFKLIFGGFLLVAVLQAFASGTQGLVSIAISIGPIILFIGLMGLLFAKVRGKFATPEHNTFLLTQSRAVHVFLHGDTTNIASVLLDSRTSVTLSLTKSGSGTLMFKRKPGPKEPVATIPLLVPKRSSWSGLRFNSVPQAEYVRDVAQWAIAQNSVATIPAVS
jgi:hypothetical protein